MEQRSSRKEKGNGNKNRKRNVLLGVFVALVVSAIAGYAAVYLDGQAGRVSPREMLTAYMAHIPRKEYDEMYAMLDVEASGQISRKDFVERNSAIYEGIEIENMAVEITGYDKRQKAVSYRTSFDTAAGGVSFENEAFFQEREGEWGLVWTDALIFPELSPKDKVRVSVNRAKRGRILDRDDRVLAGQGTATSVGLVPGKLENREKAVEKVAKLLDREPEAIEKKLSARWVKEDSFVPVGTVPKMEETGEAALLSRKEAKRERERQKEMLEIPGVMLSDVEVRVYPLGEAAAHLVGYVQSVTAEDLEEHAGEGYAVDSVIGRNGMEGLFEKELRGENGCRIYIEDARGREKKEIASRLTRQGEDVQLTIDAGLQKTLYGQFREDKSCSVAMDPFTGEVLALVSTPSYDSNEFIYGLSDHRWKAMNEDEDKPMLNRFRQVFCPGSVFKPVIAAVGLDSGAIDPAEDYGREGLRWQKDESWGSYYVTTLHDCAPATLEKALICSDNIYFAKAALNIGAEKLAESLTGLGFQEEVPFAIRMQKSQYANEDTIDTEIQLADSGYGQGQILVNPLHLACLYSAFCNEGDIIKPRLVCQQEEAASPWMAGAFLAGTVERVLEALKKVVNHPEGTAFKAHREDVLLAGKTGTAEIKASKEDDSGTELGWFAVFTAEKSSSRPILLVSMTEDVKDRGGSGYVVEKDDKVLDSWFGGDDD